VQVSKAKLSLLADVLEDLIGAGKKVVIFARFRAEITEIEKIVSKLGDYRAITGSVPADDRGQAVEDFQKDPGVKTFIAQIQTAGFGNNFDCR